MFKLTVAKASMERTVWDIYDASSFSAYMRVTKVSRAGWPLGSKKMQKLGEQCFRPDSRVISKKRPVPVTKDGHRQGKGWIRRDE